MKYNFKTKQAVMEIEHCVKRYMDEKMPGYDPCVDLSSDPRSLVAALLINQYFPKRAHVVYVEDRANDRVDDEVIEIIEKKFNDRFHKIDTNKCEPYRNCLDIFTYDDPMTQFGNHMNLKTLYLESEFQNFVFLDPMDTVQFNTGFNTLFDETFIPIFYNLIFDEIVKIGKALKLEEDFLLSLYNKSDIIRLHEKIIDASVLDIGKSVRENDEVQPEFIRLAEKHAAITNISLDKMPVKINITAIYDLIG